MSKENKKTLTLNRIESIEKQILRLSKMQALIIERLAIITKELNNNVDSDLMSVIPEKKSCMGITLTDRIRDGLPKIGDRLEINEKERKSAYNCALQVGFKICSRKQADGKIYMYRLK